MKKSLPLVFFGNERLTSGIPSTTAPILHRLIDEGYTIGAVISHHTSAKSRNARELEIAKTAKKYNIPVFLPKTPLDIIDDLKAINPVAAILVAYGKIIPKKVIDLFPQGIINIHPSLLPQYRGPTPIEQAILDGAHETGISVMQLTAAMDAGPIYVQQEMTLQGSETKQDLNNQMLQLGADLLSEHLPDILSGRLLPTPQNHEQATYCSLLKKSDGIMIPEQKTAAQLEREVRAYANFPKSQLFYRGAKLIILKVQVAHAPSSDLFMIQCKDNTYLEVQELIGPSGKKMSGIEFLRGFRPKD